MLGLAVLFLLIAILAYAFGAGHAGDLAVQVAKICGVIFLVLLVLSFVVGGTYGGWPVYRTF